MAQAGIHGLAGMALRKWTPNREWFMLGIVLGNIMPDADNLAVAVATVTGLPAEGLHRTFTHSLFTVAAVVVAFYVIARATKRPRWGNLGLGLGIGILMHVLLDLLVWFNGVEILWPIPSWVNLWSNVTPPQWWSKLMLPAEFLCFALFFVLLDVTARKQDTDSGFLRTLRM
ncbi:MAG: metal-dependent hydrolase [Anaerolineales bacterium]|nr:MAG: metal-dependent hydrolase [Anaerolineales bacterium]